MFFKPSRIEWVTNRARQVPLMWSALLILLVTTSNISTTKAQNNIPSDSNTKFDPEAGRDENTISCTIPPYQKPAFEATNDMCQAATVELKDLTNEEKLKLAYEYAPYLFFHPLENYTIETVDATFDFPDEGEIWRKGPFHKVKDTLDQSFLLETIRNIDLSMHSDKYFFAHEMTEEYKKGAHFSDPEGNVRKSRAPIYFNAFQYKKSESDTHYTWVFNYYFYYTYNGVANMVSLSSFNGTESYTSFLLSPFGLHEGDWEGMSVMVCPSKVASQPLAVTYQQHGWQQTTDCTAGECTFFKDSNNPVGFSALSSHATFPLSTENVVYSTVDVGFFVNLQGVLVVDRTAYLAEDGTYSVFVPNMTNLIEIEDPQETYDDDKKWQGFGGFWGNSTKPKILPELHACLSDDQTMIVDCPTTEEDPIFNLVMQVLGVREPGDDLISQAASAFGQAVVPVFSQTGKGPTGPILKNHWNDWPDPSNAPLWDGNLDPKTTAAEYCERLTEIPDTSRLPPDSKRLDVMGHLIGIICMVVILVVLSVVLLWVEKKMRQPLLQFDPDTGEVIRPTKRAWFQIHATALTFFFWWLVIVIGAIIFAVALVDLFNLLKQYVSGIDWDAIGDLMWILGIFIMVTDAVLCVLIWLPSESLWKKIMQIYHHYKGEEGEVEAYQQDRCNLSFQKLHTMFLVFFPLLFVSLMLTLVVVVAGVAVVGFSAAFNEICDATVGSLGPYCLDLPFFNIDEVACGAEFKHFCNEWATSERIQALWGAILVGVGHFYLVGAAGASHKQQSEVMPMLDMLPRRKDYRQKIEDLRDEHEDNPQASKTASATFMDNIKA